MNLCPSCLQNIDGKKFCPYCGFNPESYVPTPHSLPLLTVVGGHYKLGCSMAEDGSCITYSAVDDSTAKRCTVREYFPADIAERAADGNSVVPLAEKADVYKENIADAEKTAKLLVNCKLEGGVMRTLDFFCENGTFYTVTEYAEGVKLESYLDDNGGKIDPETAFELMKPVLASLSEIHKLGIIHKALDPEHVFYTFDEELVVFGFASVRSANGTKNLSSGYAAPEQYRESGRVGTWTDVYSVCALIYRMITGKKPPRATDRMSMDDLVKPTEFCDISAAAEKALLDGMKLDPAKRISSVDVLINAFYNNEMPPETAEDKPTEAEKKPSEIPVKEEHSEPVHESVKPAEHHAEKAPEPAETVYEPPAKKKSKAPLIVLACILIAAAAAVGIAYSNGIFGGSSQPAETVPEQTEVSVTVSETESSEAETAETEISETSAETTSADIDIVPELTGMNVDEVKTKLDAEGIRYMVIELNDPEAEQGVVYRQEPAAGSEKSPNEPIRLFVLPSETAETSAAETAQPMVFSWNTAVPVNSQPPVGNMLEIRGRLANDLSAGFTVRMDEMLSTVGGSFTSMEPQYSYISDDFDGDGEAEYYVSVYLDYYGWLSEHQQPDKSGGAYKTTAFYYVDNDGKIKYLFSGSNDKDNGKAYSNGNVTNFKYILGYGTEKHVIIGADASNDKICSGGRFCGDADLANSAVDGVKITMSGNGGQAVFTYDGTKYTEDKNGTVSEAKWSE